jgi:hypothetical protein
MWGQQKCNAGLIELKKQRSHGVHFIVCRFRYSAHVETVARLAK